MPRPVLAAVSAQQKQIDAMRHEIIVLKSQLHHIANVAGLDEHMTKIRVKADVNNPAQPWPDPPSEPAFETTEEALAPDANDNVQNPGMTPGSVDDLAADSTTTPLVPGEALPTSPYNVLQNVQAPVAGTEGPLPLEQVRTETDVRVGDPTNPQVAFPLIPAFSAKRPWASLRLARLQIEAGVAAGDDITLGETIASSDKSDDWIEGQIETLSQVRKAASRQPRPGGLVPRAASVQRTTPSLTSESSSASEDMGDDDALFD